MALIQVTVKFELEVDDFKDKDAVKEEIYFYLEDSIDEDSLEFKIKKLEYSDEEDEDLDY